MARKLTPEELERYKGDFDPPGYVPPRAKKKLKSEIEKELFAADEKPAKRGRRQIHDTGRQVSIWLEDNELDALRIAAAMRRVSVSEMGAVYIRQGLKDAGRLK